MFVLLVLQFCSSLPSRLSSRFQLSRRSSVALVPSSIPKVIIISLLLLSGPPPSTTGSTDMHPQFPDCVVACCSFHFLPIYLLTYTILLVVFIIVFRVISSKLLYPSLTRVCLCVYDVTFYVHCSSRGWLIFQWHIKKSSSFPSSLIVWSFLRYSLIEEYLQITEMQRLRFLFRRHFLPKELLTMLLSLSLSLSLFMCVYACMYVPPCTT